MNVLDKSQIIFEHSDKTSLTVRLVSERHLLSPTQGSPTTKYPLLQSVYSDPLYVHVEFVTQNEVK